MFEGKVAIVTGAARGIGKAVAASFAEYGSKVVIIDIDENRLEETAEELSKKSGEGNIIAIKVDVSDSAEVNDAVNSIIKKWNKVDILVNCAGIDERNRITETTDEILDKVLAINLKGTFYFCRAVAPSMIKNKYGKIISISSVSAKTKSIFSGPSYNMSKAAINGLTRTLSGQLAEYNINVNAVAPSLVETEMMKELVPEEKNLVLNGIPLGRLAGVMDVVEPIVFLASDKAGYITGEIMDINGGSFVD